MAYGKDDFYFDSDLSGFEDFIEQSTQASDPSKETQKICLCGLPSTETLIGCNNDDYPVQWFHLTCVGIS